MQKKGSGPDFTEPWHMSDVVLIVEDKKYHVHKATLSMWSPVFEKMFTAGFMEKNATEIALSGKKAKEIKEMLLVIYPMSKLVTEENCYYLLSLAQEYQMEQLTERCEKYLLQREKTPFQAIDFLVIAHLFDMTELGRQCVEIAKHMSLCELRKHDKYSQIEPEVGRHLADRRIEMLEMKVNGLEQKGNSIRKEIKDACESAIKDLGKFYYSKKYPDRRHNLAVNHLKCLEESAHENGEINIILQLLQQRLKKIYEPQHM
jgi:hypothetical protein